MVWVRRHLVIVSVKQNTVQYIKVLGTLRDNARREAYKGKLWGLVQGCQVAKFLVKLLEFDRKIKYLVVHTFSVHGQTI